MKLLLSSLPLIVVPLLALPCSAQRQVFDVNPGASEVKFTLGASDHATRGTFHVERGTISFDPAAPKMEGAVLVAAGSGKTGNDGRDKKMTNDVLDASHFAEVSFSPLSYQGTVAPSGDSTVQITGTFTLHGTAHELSVPMQVHIDGTACTARAD